MIKNGKNSVLEAYLNAATITRQGALWIDQQGNILDANSVITKELGYDDTEINTKTIFEINPSISLLTWKRYWKQLQEEDLIIDEAEYITAEGSIYPVQLSGIMAEIEGETRCCILSENLLEKNRFKNLLQLTSEVSRIGSWEWDLMKDQFTASAIVYDLLFISKETSKITTRSLFPILNRRLASHNLEKLQQHWRQALKSGQPFELELPFQLESGGSRPYNLRAVPIMTEGQTIKMYGTLQDVSTIAARSEDMYLAQFTVENTSRMVLWVKPDGSFSYTNEAVRKILGYSKEELMGMRTTDLNLIEPETSWEETWQKLKKKKEFEFETTIRTADHTFLPIYATFNFIEYRSNEYICIFLKDMSLRKERERHLMMTQFSIDEAREMIYWVNEAGFIVYTNQASAKNLGYTVEELKRMKLSSVSPDVPEEKWPEYWQQVKESKLLPDYESVQRTKDGTIYPIELSASYLEFEGQEILCIFARNITERKQRQEELERALEEVKRLSRQLKEDKVYLQDEINLHYNFNDIITKNANYRHVLKQVEQVADTMATVLILGETGTGKELLARAIHNLSTRRSRPMVKVNCAALPENLIESELFGHEKGAFTGAFQRKTGRFELANQGTIFLDEIGELPLDLQSKLLRVLQEGEFERLGSPTTVKVDVRIIAATNRNLEQMVKEGTFRQDLYYRLYVFPINNPPLRERRDDIPLLVQHFLEKYASRAKKPITKVPQWAMDKLLQYDFPGNIRELENLIERAIILTNDDTLNLEVVLPTAQENSDGLSNKFLTFEEAQRQHILEALRKTHWKITGSLSASELLNINGKTLASKMRKLNIYREDFLDI